MTDNVKFKDFSKKRKAVYFTLDGAEFHCAPGLPLDLLQELALLAGDTTPENAAGSIKEFFKLSMEDDSYTRIIAKMSDKKDPLELDQALSIMEWLLEAYGLRPTQPSSNSSDGSPTDDAGTPSGAGD